MSKTYVAEVIGDAGSPVVLIPGGAAQSKSFFPHLEAALAHTHRVVLVDRQGTGRAASLGPASLTSGSAAYAEVLRDLGAGPAVVVAQSLGGAVAVQLVMDHPELVSGLVLIDPTPFNSPKTMRTIGPLAKIMTAPCGLPVVGRRFERFLTVKAGQSCDELGRSSLEVMADHRGLYLTGKALDALPAEAAALTARLTKFDAPSVLLTADRKPDHKVRRRHDELMAALGGRVVSWPGAKHGEHLREPHKVVDLVQTLIDEIHAKT